MHLIRRLPHTPGNGSSLLRLVPLVLAICLVSSCGGDDGGSGFASTNPLLPPMEVESGSFDVASEFAFNGCNSATTYDGRYSIAITDSMFTMGGWSGDWQADPNQLKAHGETGRSSVETRGCTITTWTEVDLTFTSEDNFYGHVTYRKRVMGTCACCPQCTSTWSITGVRVTN